MNRHAFTRSKRKKSPRNYTLTFTLRHPYQNIKIQKKKSYFPKFCCGFMQCRLQRAFFEDKTQRTLFLPMFENISRKKSKAHLQSALALHSLQPWLKTMHELFREFPFRQHIQNACFCLDPCVFAPTKRHKRALCFRTLAKKELEVETFGFLLGRKEFRCKNF